MKIKYCLPIIKSSKEEVLQEILQNIDNYDFFEVWLDYIEDLDKNFIEILLNKFNDKLILLFRRQNLERGKLSVDFRREIIKLLDSSDNLLDLDIFDQKEDLEFVNQNNLRIKKIVSYHNYEQTPALDELQKITEEMDKFNPDILKVSTFCQNKEDGLKLLSLILMLKKNNKKFIILGMGEDGLITRIFGALWGNELSFAPVDLKEKSAEGQLTKGQLENILKEIN